MPIDPILNFKAELESQIFQKTHKPSSPSWPMKLNNIDLSELKQQFRIAAIEFGVNIAEAISGSFQAVQTLVHTNSGDHSPDRLLQLSDLYQQSANNLKRLDKKAIDVEKERRVNTSQKNEIEAQRGRSLTSAEMKTA